MQSVRTDYELVVEKILKDNNFPFFYIDQIFCFHCYRYFPNHYVNYCVFCGKYFKAKNQMALPDFVIDTNPNKLTKRTKLTPDQWEKYLRNITIVKVDGELHGKKHNRYVDYHQFNKFREKNIRVVILLNESISRKDKKNHREIYKKLIRLSEYEKLQEYEKYLKSKDFEEAFRIPLEFLYRKLRPEA